MARGAQKEQSQAKKLAREKGSTPEERAAARKAAEAGAQAATCAICKQTFSTSQARGNPPTGLMQHHSLKHANEPIPKCFPHLNEDGTKKVDDTPKKDKADKKKKAAPKKGGGGKSNDLPPELLAAMAGASTKDKKKKKK